MDNGYDCCIYPFKCFIKYKSATNSPTHVLATYINFGVRDGHSQNAQEELRMYFTFDVPTRWNGVVIFRKDNPNFEITETHDEIVALFKKNPVPVEIRGKIVGIVRDVEFWANEDELIGDILFWIKPPEYMTLVNYGVRIDDDGNIELISFIEYGPPYMAQVNFSEEE